MLDPEDAHTAIEDLNARLTALEDLLGAHGIHVAEGNTINGIWITPPGLTPDQFQSFPLISIYGERNAGGSKTVIGFAPNASKFTGGYPLAIVATEDEVTLQILNELGETKHYSLDALARALEHHGG